MNQKDNLSNPPNKYHVHVYKIDKFCELDVFACSEEEARKIALERSEEPTSVWKERDINKIALSFEIK